jgi:gamma-glutamylcyclotransferase (GGCT)/AIG2-like uncharacterized protein YtfP
MRQRCPQSKKLGIGRLPGYRWIISGRGYANVIKSKDDEVEGVLYLISDSDENSLDKHEGIAWGSYGKATLRVAGPRGEEEALIYVDPVTEEGVPKKEYIKRINSGLADAKLSAEYVSRYVRRFIPS